MAIRQLSKCIAVKLPFVKKWSLRLTQHTPRIFMFHRFDETGALGIAAAEFEWRLQTIARHFRTMRLCDYVADIEKGIRPANAVIITVDDGYWDFYRVAFPLLRKYGFKATLFVTTRFIDGEIWFWWDKLRSALTQADSNATRFVYRGRTFDIRTSSEDDINRTWKTLASYCLGLPEAEKAQFVLELARSVNIALSPSASPEFRGMTWPEILDVMSKGVEVGSHTLNHPIMTALKDEHAMAEIALSKEIIEKRTGQAVKTFAYPNGQSGDYNDTLTEVLRGSGYRAAVVAHNGMCNVKHNPYAVTRISPTDRTDFLWKLYGIDHVLLRMRRFQEKLHFSAALYGWVKRRSH